MSGWRTACCPDPVVGMWGWGESMGTVLREHWIIVGGIAVVAAVAWRTVAAARRRRIQFRRGEICELGHLWNLVEGRRVFARVSRAAAGGDGVPVVLVHGLGVSGSYFVPTAERLAPEFAVYVPDLPGHGRSDSPREPFEIPRLADALVAWMDAVGLDRVSFVANSMGCQVVVDAALRHPGRVDRLVLIGPTADPSGRRMVQLLGRLVRCIPFERPSLIGLVLKDYARMGLRLVTEVRSMVRGRIEDDLPRLDAPTLLVRGEHDAVAPRRWVDEAARRAGAGRVVVIPWWGHAVNYSAAGPLVEAIAPFLREAHQPREPGVRGTAFERTGNPRD
jgi:2-hydroxy-6-oxonona-2,4-dienedioate hydrolase